MPRTLPWMLDAPKAKLSPRSATVTPKRRRDPSPGDLVNSDLEDLTKNEPPRRSRPRSRTPSTSPPPGPPEVTFMREGYDADDSYRMVEDEFFATAKLFTNHIHFQEYVRLKKLARARGKDALAGLRRGTDGHTEKSRYLKLKEGAIEDARKRGDLADSESEDEYLQDPQLAGLMTSGYSHQSNDKDLSSLMSSQPKTRAAAGFTNSPQKEIKTRDVFASSPPAQATSSHREVEEDEETDDDDDLNNPPPMTINANALPRSTAGDSRMVESSKRSADQRIASQSSLKPSFKAASEQFDASNLEDKRAQAAKYIAERNQLRQQKREKEKRHTSAKNVEIPTFIL